jgi:hypothetical protein
LKVENEAVRLKYHLLNPIEEERINHQKDLDKEGGTFFHPGLQFRLVYLGKETLSPILRFSSVMVLLYETIPGKAGLFEGKTIQVQAPDGIKTAYTIPEDGRIEIIETLPGNYLIDESDLED